MYETPRLIALADLFVVLPDQLHDKLEALESAAQIILDLHGVETVDPHVLAELAKIRQHRRKRGLLLGRLVVGSPHLRSALTAVAFDRHWLIFKTLEEAIASFKSAPLYA
jgi:anti-anti-sigma regulatory factor